MAEKKPFLLRADPTVMKALRRWADDDFRSLNGQIEYLLRRALQDAGRLKRERSGPRASTDEPTNKGRGT